MRVIGTAGHVDHGKSTLIAALTGIHPDRLKEEQAREMTIDLGFGWMTLPDGQEIGIVDVPGHRDFIENMLAGVGGIDAALLVIAADEGVMPQTREHLAILDLLQIQAGLIVLTKTDLITDPGWLDLVEADIRLLVKGTPLQDAPILRVSARTRSGLEQLTGTLAELLRGLPARPDLGRPRLPIDRVFSMPGFGTVVTGTLIDGRLAQGDEVEILPSGLRGRIRGLQTHQKKEQEALPASRTAVNVSGLDLADIRRGQVLAHPGQYTATRRLDARLRLLKDVTAPLRHAGEVKLFAGTSETMATVRLLGTEELAAGQEGWIQLELRDPLVAVRGDRYVLRRPSPGETLGGGIIVDPQPKGRHKRFEAALLKSLAALNEGAPSDVLMEAALTTGAATAREIVQRARLEPAQAEVALREMIAAGTLVQLEPGEAGPSSELLLIARPGWEDLRGRIEGILVAYHQQNPLRGGIAREELKSRIKLPARTFNAALGKLASEGGLAESGSSVARAGHQIVFDPARQAKVDALMRRFAAAPFAPPSLKECQAGAGEEVVDALVELGELVALTNEVVFRKQDYDSMIARVRAYIQEHGRISVAEARDLFDSSRKYMLALLEHLDASGITSREGDFRRLRA
jgi:selenocysteine-specific elongation factor